MKWICSVAGLLKLFQSVSSGNYCFFEEQILFFVRHQPEPGTKFVTKFWQNYFHSSFLDCSISIHLTFLLLYSGEQIRKDNLSSKTNLFPLAGHCSPSMHKHHSKINLINSFLNFACTLLCLYHIILRHSAHQLKILP